MPTKHLYLVCRTGAAVFTTVETSREQLERYLKGEEPFDPVDIATPEECE